MYKSLNPILYYAIVLITLTGVMLLYFRIATRMEIVDKPNQRSSHQVPTVRGGGVIFLVALLMWFVSEGFKYPWFIASAVILAVISFADDLRPQPALLRSTIQLIAFSLMGIEAGLFHQPVILVVIALVIGIGSLNAFNFMDGINGITGVYALVNLLTLYYINSFVVLFTNEALLVCVILSVLVFLFFNFRTRAKCFAGDVGSVSIAFIQLFFVLQLIYTTDHYGWCFLFLLYGIDSIVTIIYRLKRKENIFKAHRTHLYQYFSNELKVPHLQVSTVYGIIQLLVNTVLIVYLMKMPFSYFIAFVIAAGLLYVVIREMVLRRIGSVGLFVRYKA